MTAPEAVNLFFNHWYCLDLNDPDKQQDANLTEPDILKDAQLSWWKVCTAGGKVNLDSDGGVKGGGGDEGGSGHFDVDQDSLAGAEGHGTEGAQGQEDSVPRVEGHGTEGTQGQ
ncbi:hypothetical protein BDR04DRAFT_1123034 [Suillus decipiens]|nr:hypothetical protein BDR04DRAFT_1123034 [Suillus decipiens]